MILRRRLPLVPGLALLGLFAGCSGGGDGGSYATVSGTVTYKGAPLEGAKVQFVSTTESGGTRGEYATETDASGRYMIAGVADKPGIPPGMYKVLVTKLVLKPGFQAPEEGWDLTQLEMSGMGKNSLPNAYGSYETTKLSAPLEAGKNEDVNFDLK